MKSKHYKKHCQSRAIPKRPEPMGRDKDGSRILYRRVKHDESMSLVDSVGDNPQRLLAQLLGTTTITKKTNR